VISDGARGMRKVLLAVAILAGVAAAMVLGQFALIEIGREVVTLRTPRPDGTWRETRLWIVDDGGSSWLHSAGADWLKRFEGDPVVELVRGGEVRRYRAHAVPGPHPRVDGLLREKYGIADRWVRFIAPDDEATVAVRLDPMRG
jgi:hypothetical protein